MRQPGVKAPGQRPTNGLSPAWAISRPTTSMTVIPDVIAVHSIPFTF